MATPTSPVLLTPSNNATVHGNVLIFTFTVPTDTDNDGLVFRIELDTNSPINPLSSHYKVNESRFAMDLKTHGKWEVNNSSVWEIIPTGGLSSDYYGKEAKITIRKQDTVNYPDISGYWYWQISASDNMITEPIYNQVIFGQCIFS